MLGRRMGLRGGMTDLVERGSDLLVCQAMSTSVAMVG